MARVFAIRVQIAGRIRVSRYKFYCVQVTSHVTLSFTGSTKAVGLHTYQLSVRIAGTKCKNRDSLSRAAGNLLILSCLLAVSGLFICLGRKSIYFFSYFVNNFFILNLFFVADFCRK
jgi:hypothetical protein